MKTILLTASIVSNLFLCALLYGFTSGKVERNHDTIGAMYDAERVAKPVTLTRN